MNRVDAAPERNGFAGSHRLPCTRRRAHAGFRRRDRAHADPHADARGRVRDRQTLKRFSVYAR
ncbi:hypothetical protein WL53_02135 [Burkholderia ubonensis]|nr:hypothetical protein WL53_02135 [Burkholderia ubonensis]